MIDITKECECGGVGKFIEQGSTHTALRCSECNKWITWIKKSEVDFYHKVKGLPLITKAEPIEKPRRKYINSIQDIHEHSDCIPTVVLADVYDRMLSYAGMHSDIPETDRYIQQQLRYVDHVVRAVKGDDTIC